MKLFVNITDGHKYYSSAKILMMKGEICQISINEGYNSVYLREIGKWSLLSVLREGETGKSPIIRVAGNGEVCIMDWLLIDLTEMFGAGNEPTKEECDRMFACMGALPQGLTVAQPAGLKSIGYNQWNPDNVLEYKSVSAGTIIGVSGSHIAVIECLPCKTGTGENNGYVIGYGEGDTWSDEGIEVYLTPLNPMEVDGELYLQKLDKDATYGTYVPQIKGYLLVVTPTTDKLCAHFHWSGDRAMSDYEPYTESTISFPVIPQMSEWGLAGIAWNKEYIQDTIDLEKNEYCKRVFLLNFKDRIWYNNGNLFYADFGDVGVRNMIICNGYARTAYNMASLPDDKTIMYSGQYVYIHDLSFSGNITGFRDYIKDKFAYIAVNTKETYPIVTKAAPNYIGSDYGVEEFTGNKVPLVANILFYMRSLVSETRNFLDRLMARLGTSDATAVADRIVAAVAASEQPTVVSDEQMAE